MKNLNKMLEIVLRDCDFLGIKYGKIVEIVPNSRAKSRWGQCQRRCDGFHININAELLQDNVPDYGALNTIAHEVCHTIDGCMNHGATWKKNAKLLGTLGYVIKRVDSAEDKGLNTRRHVQDSGYKYVIECTQCGNKSYYMRRGKAVDHIMRGYKNYRCSKCGCMKLIATEL